MTTIDSINDRTGIIIITHRTHLREALAEMTKAFFAYYFQLGADSQMSVTITFEIKPICEPKS